MVTNWTIALTSIWASCLSYLSVSFCFSFGSYQWTLAGTDIPTLGPLTFDVDEDFIVGDLSGESGGEATVSSVLSATFSWQQLVRLQMKVVTAIKRVKKTTKAKIRVKELPCFSSTIKSLVGLHPKVSKSIIVRVSSISDVNRENSSIRSSSTVAG